MLLRFCTDIGEGDNHTHAALLGDQMDAAAYEYGLANCSRRRTKQLIWHPHGSKVSSAS